MVEDTAVIPIHCPMFYKGERCNGVLNRKSVFHTDMGTHQGVDLNHFTETFVCATCKATVYRAYQWRVPPEAPASQGNKE
jgi:hypothetical protein